MIEYRIRSIVAKERGTSPELVSMSDKLDDFDSIDTLSFLMGLEEEFDIHIQDKDIDKLKTVGDAISYIEGKM